MKSEVVKQRLQNPAAAAGGDDQVLDRKYYIYIPSASVWRRTVLTRTRLFSSERHKPRHTDKPCLQGAPAPPMLVASCNPVVLVFWAIFFKTSWRFVFRKMENYFKILGFFFSENEKKGEIVEG